MFYIFTDPGRTQEITDPGAPGGISAGGWHLHLHHMHYLHHLDHMHYLHHLP